MKNDLLKHDVVVVGGGAAGVMAAVAAARRGVDVLLIEQSGYVGGLLVSGLPILGYLDYNGRQVVAGLAQEIIDRLMALDKDGSYGHSRCALHNSVTIVHPELLKIVLFNMCTEAGVKLLLHTTVIDTDVESGTLKRITAFGKGHKLEIEAKVFVDCTGDGDVAYMAGATFNKGQEDTGVLQPPTVLFTLGGVDLEKFISFLEEHPEELKQAESIQAGESYNPQHFRNTKSHVFFGLKNLFSKLKAQGVEGITRDTFIYINSPREGQVVINGMRILNFDGSDVYDLTRGEVEGYGKILDIINIAKKYIPGFENCFLSSITPTIGVRESRRIKGIDYLTVDRVLNYEVPEDTIALGSYCIDIHSGVSDTSLMKQIAQPYGIPYGCLVSADLKGLMMAGRNISVDAEVLGSTRVMTVCMALGEAAGVGAALAAKGNILPAKVNASDVVEILRKNGAILKSY